MAMEIITVRVNLSRQPMYSILSSEYDHLVEDYLKHALPRVLQPSFVRPTGNRIIYNY